MSLRIPEYNTVRSLLSVTRILLIIVLVLTIITILGEAGYIVVATFGVDVVFVPFILIFVAISLIPTILALVYVSKTRRILDQAIEQRNPDLVEEARKNMLIWGIVTLIFSWIVPGILLLIAYFKAEEITEKLSGS